MVSEVKWGDIMELTADKGPSAGAKYAGSQMEGSDCLWQNTGDKGPRMDQKQVHDERSVCNETWNDTVKRKWRQH